MLLVAVRKRGFVVCSRSSRGFSGEESTDRNSAGAEETAVCHYGETSPGVFQKILQLLKLCTSILNMDLAVIFVA